MRKLLLLLLLLGQLPAMASEIVVGLRSDKLISWGVWERQGTTLTHYLLLYNKSSQPLDLVIREWASEVSRPTRGKTGKLKTLHHSKLPVNKLVRLLYPKTRAQVDLMEYLENNVSMGVLLSNASRPDAPALAGTAYRYYTNEGASSHIMSYWLAFNSLTAPPTQLRLTAGATAFSFSTPYRRGEETYSLVKLYPSYASAPQQSGTLDSLAAAGPNPTIARLDSAHQTVLVPASRSLSPAQFLGLVLLIENVEHSFRYNEQRQLVLGKSVSGMMCLLPFFPPQPD